MALVDYGGSDSEHEQAAPAPRKKAAGPKKILLDLPAPAEEPPRKRPKFALGSGSSGLSSMLPAPKAAPLVAKKPPKPAVEEDDAERRALRELLGSEAAPVVEKEKKAPVLVPSSVAKGKQKAEPAAPSTTDFFGLAPSSSARASSSTSSAISAAPAFSAAPATIDKEPSPPPGNYYATLPPPSAANPYPGFHALSSGKWVADRPEEWAVWCAENGMSMTGESLDAPDEARNKDMVDIEGVGTVAGGPEASTIPSKVVESKAIPERAMIMGGRGGNKHQLSSLLYQAHANRQELEDKISQAKANRKSGGQRYGF